MKIILAGSILLAAQVSFACPNLSGTYSCTSEGKTVEMTYAQSELNGVTTYVVSAPGEESSELIADGNSRIMSNGEAAASDQENAMERYSCVGETVVAENWTQTLATDGSALKSNEYTDVISLDEKGNLSFNDGNSVEACVRIK